MKIISQHILMAIIAFFFVACTSKEKLLFEKEENISSISVENSPFLGLPIVLIHFENKLLISDFHTESLLTIFDLNENKVITSMVRKGVGPNEALPPLMISLVNDTLLAFDKSKFQLSYYTLKGNDDMQGKNSFLFPVPTQISQLTYVHNNIYLASGYFENKRYGLLNTKGELGRMFGNFPDFFAGERERPVDAKAMFHQIRGFEANRSVKKIACLSSHVLDIIDFSDYIHVFRSIQLDTYDYKYSTGNIIHTDKTTDTSVGAIDITSTDEYIYVLFNYSKNHLSGLTNDIWVFDWAGSPIKKIKLDKNIHLITAVNDNLLYALALVGEDYSIVKLNLF